MAEAFQKSDGMNYAPKGKAAAVVAPGEFKFAAVGLDHGHIFGMCNGLMEAGAELVYVSDLDPAKVADFISQYPSAKAATLDEVLADPQIKLIAAAIIPGDRADLGVKVMESGKDYFTDKPPMVSLSDLEKVRHAIEKTGKKYMVYFSERIHVESSMMAYQLIKDGAIGKVLHVDGFGPHRIGDMAARPDWFVKKDQYGGIICDIGSHQVEQFLAFTGATDATVQLARVANYHHKAYPGLEDFGDVALVGDNGATGYFRVDWFTPNGLPTWGDGRIFIVGTEGTIELRKYINVGTDVMGTHVFLVNQNEAKHINAEGLVGFTFFGDLILDCINRTENAMAQAHVLKAAEIVIKAQLAAVKIQ